MPGMMDTILNLGLNDETVKGLVEVSKNERFSYDAYRRLIQMFGNVVKEIEKDDFEKIISEKKREKDVQSDTELSAEDWKDVVVQFKKVYKEKTKEDFPQDPYQQIQMSEMAVFNSWNTPRAKTYRKLNDISDTLGTAVNVQMMVFGNLGEDSGTGVGFTRDPGTGEKKFYGEYLKNAQGEDVVSGARTPIPIVHLKEDMPDVYKELVQITGRLEKHYRDVQDFEFTIERGKLYMLQTRTGKRTAMAAVKIACDMVKEGLISEKEALMRLEPEQIEQLLHPIIDPEAKFDVLTKGLPASPGAATGKIVFTSDEAVEKSKEGEVILVRPETTPDDIHGMDAAVGILTSRGGMTSHAAVVARGMGKPCVAGCEAIKIDEERGEIKINEKVFKREDFLTIDGATGSVIDGKVPLIKPTLSGEFGIFLDLARKVKRLGIRANADIPRDARVAIEFGAEGIGLCRTEHMFFAPERLPIVQKMILSKTEEERKRYLDELLPFQKEDFLGLFREMKGRPVIIRTIDPPLHEFLPKREDLMVEIATMKAKGETGEKLSEKEKLLSRVEELHELNPMLGHRGCRLGITYPEITEMQVRAIMEAACQLKKEGGEVLPEIMIPLVGNVNELKNQKEVVKKTAEKVLEEYGVNLKYLIGTMIEIPRAAVTADEIAQEAEFFSFGTNDLTQMGMGFSRDDAGRFINDYLERGIFTSDPFQTLDQKGIGELIRIGIEKGRRTNPKLEIGICGEHGGDPESVKFCHRVGMDYVSCSPYRIPVATLAAAQAVIEEKNAL